MQKFSDWMMEQFECSITPKDAYDKIDAEVSRRIGNEVRLLFQDMRTYMSEYHIDEKAVLAFEEHWVTKNTPTNNKTKEKENK